MAAVTASLLAGCAGARPEPPADPLIAAILVPSPLPVPGPPQEPGPQPDATASLTGSPGAPEPLRATAPSAIEPERAEMIEPRDAQDPTDRVARANAAARVEPTQDGYINAVQLYAFEEGALFQVYAAPNRITDIALQPGEFLSEAGPVAAGDTSRWIIGDTRSGTGAQARIHILIKPTRPSLRTNLIINTDRRTYHLELRSTAETAMASVSWRYPRDELIALQTASARQAERAPEPSLDIDALAFDYRITGDAAAWRPVRAFDDGRQVFIEFGPGLDASTLPPLFVRSADGRSAELVNYRFSGRRMVVDRLFAVAELRLAGPRGHEKVVRIEKAGGRAR